MSYEAVRLNHGCLICGSNAWWLLPVPVVGRSMLSDGRVIPESLEKGTCSVCGLVQHAYIGVESRAKEIFGSGYLLSDHEPNIGFEGGRQRQYADWIQGVVRGKLPGTVLELGSGNGSLLKELISRFPTSKFIGLEPSDHGVRWARRAGLPVKRKYISGERSVGGIRADLVVSVNVIEHTPRPIDFLRAARAAVTKNGLVVLVCPDASVVGSELLFFDHFFSFCPSNLIDLIRQSGLEPVAYHRSPRELPGFQMVVAQLQLDDSVAIQLNAEKKSTDPHGLQADRERYMAKWMDLDQLLCREMSGFRSVAIFGAGEMARLIGAYAPCAWNKISHVVVDAPMETELAGRRIIPYSEFEAKADQAVLVAVSAYTAEKVSVRLRADGHHVLCLSDL